MKENYSNKIYKKRRSRVPLLLFLFLLLLLPLLWILLRGERETTGIKTVRTESVQNTKREQRAVLPELKAVQENAEKEEAVAAVKKPGPKAQSVNSAELAADKLFTDKKYREAFNIYKRESEKRSSPSLLKKAGLCLYSLKENEQAAEYFKKYIESVPEDYYVVKILALILYRLNELEQSLKYIESIIKVFPDPGLVNLRNKILREQKLDYKYYDQSSMHFKINFSAKEHRDVKRVVLELLESAYSEIGREMDYYPAQPVVVILYNDRDFYSVTRAPAWAGGLYDGKIRIPVRNLLQADTSHLKRIIYHEYTHALVYSLTKRCPLWFNEGLAEYFSIGDQKKIGQVIPFVHLMFRFPSSPAKVVHIAYRQSFSAVSDLIDEHGMYKIKEFLQKADKKSLEDSFYEAFYIKHSEFIRKWGKDDS